MFIELTFYWFFRSLLFFEIIGKVSFRSLVNCNPARELWKLSEKCCQFTSGYTESEWAQETDETQSSKTTGQSVFATPWNKGLAGSKIYTFQHSILQNSTCVITVHIKLGQVMLSYHLFHTRFHYSITFHIINIKAKRKFNISNWIPQGIRIDENAHNVNGKPDAKSIVKFCLTNKINCIKECYALLLTASESKCLSIFIALKIFIEIYEESFWHIWKFSEWVNGDKIKWKTVDRGTGELIFGKKFQKFLDWIKFTFVSEAANECLTRCSLLRYLCGFNCASWASGKSLCAINAEKLAELY